ncbi:twin-arginine translocation signal domain-containing protein [Candidatus Dojkabacteria bacterium]|nr:twin-arginine translocation signal domain-containing protein [Candidatus Dojkabacteria bacterium]
MNKISRREFLRLSTMAAAGVAIAACTKPKQPGAVTDPGTDSPKSEIETTPGEGDPPVQISREDIQERTVEGVKLLQPVIGKINELRAYLLEKLGITKPEISLAVQEESNPKSVSPTPAIENPENPKEPTLQEPKSDERKDQPETEFDPRKTTFTLTFRQEDYYIGRFENAVAAANQFIENLSQPIHPGTEIALIRDGIIDFNDQSAGYQSAGTNNLNASGACAFTSALGAAIDHFPFIEILEGIGHGHKHETYSGINDGYGYTVYQTGERSASPDFIFRIKQDLPQNTNGVKISVSRDGEPSGNDPNNCSITVTIELVK